MSISFVGNYGKMSDDDIIEHINNGNSTCLQILISRYMPLVRKYAVRFSKTPNDIEDLIQDGLIALYSAVRHYRTGQASFATFASLCIRRALIGEHRAAGRKRRIPPELVSSLNDSVNIVDSKDPESILLEKESLKKLTDTIKLELSSLEYRVLSAFLSGKSYEQISKTLGITQKSVDNALRRIRSKLK
ncbi:MAG: sigma-70 family RNA polymerase sigma factor [Ruminococcaceae bacterium]|nr:sigma-70 family RNA polymerase sigma factor [Oscillospiraceae bacterium]